MKPIGGIAEPLERKGQDFVVEALAKALPPEWISQALRETGRGSVRQRLLPAPLIVWLVLLMGIFRRSSYANLLEKLHGTWWTEAHWDPEAPPCTSAITKARDRLGVEPLKLLFERSAGAWGASSEGAFFAGRRILALDGGTFKTPDTSENERAFARPGASRGRSAYPQMRAVALLDVGPRLVLAARTGPFRGPGSGEISLARDLAGRIERGALVLIDRNFCAYGFLWDLRRRGADFLVRAPRGIQTRPLRRLGENDALVEWRPSRRSWRARPDLPRAGVLREITFRPEGGSEAIRLFTTLTDPGEAPADDLARLYHERWEEETVLDEIKTHLCDGATVNRAVVFRSQRPGRVEQEFWGLLIAYNAVRRVMAEAARAKRISPRRLSFTAALERLREAVRDMMQLPTSRLPARYARMLAAIARARVPERPGRSYPRAVKIKMSQYPLKETRHVA